MLIFKLFSFLCEKSYSNLISAIEKCKNTALPNFIYALGINNVGLSNAKLLCKKFDNSLNKIRKADFDTLVSIDGFGDVIANSILKYFSHEKNNKLIENALKYITFTETEENTNALKLENLTFVITGDVHHYKNRKELQSHIEQLGGKVTGSVSNKTNYLINNDVNSPSSKNKKAKDLGIPIIGEEEFLKLINN